MTRILPVFILLLLTSCRPDPQPVPANPKDSLLVFLMAGQSNMAGRGIIEAQDTISNPRIVSMNAANEFVIAKEPLNFYQPGLSGLDCGVSFANNLLPYTSGKVGLIQCAVGSVRIEDYLHDSTRVVPLYSNMLARGLAGARTGHLKGILWHQGESNAEDASALLYAVNLKALIHNWRRDFRDEGLPVFIGKIAPFTKRPYRDEVNAAIDETARTLPRVFVIETADLTCKPDSVHFDSRSQRVLGERFAAAARSCLH